MSPLSKDQWISVIRNSIFAFLAVSGGILVTTITTKHSVSNADLLLAGSAGLMAAFKIVEKVFTPVA